MGKEYRLDRDFREDIASRKTGEQTDTFRDFWLARQNNSVRQTIKEEELTMGRVLMIGAGGVATVAAFKIAQNADVFTDFMIASRRKAKCDKIVADIHKAGYDMDIKTAQVNADDVEQLKALFCDYKPELVINLALPYQDLTIMDACLATTSIRPTMSRKMRHTSNTPGSGPTKTASSRLV